MLDQLSHLNSVGVYCSSSDAADPLYRKAAAEFGGLLARNGVRLVYGGGGIGLMGACARAAHAAGGRVLGVMPEFLRTREVLFDEVETVVVKTMHQRKQIMFDAADGFAIFPGGIGTLEEVVELMSWRRLNLHAKPIVFYNPGGFWTPLFQLMQHTVRERLTPPDFLNTYAAVDRVEELLPRLNAMARAAPAQVPAAAPSLM